MRLDVNRLWLLALILGLVAASSISVIVAQPIVTVTPSPSLTPATHPLENFLQHLQTRWHCFMRWSSIYVVQEEAYSAFALYCPVAAADSISIGFAQYPSEFEARRAFNPPADAILMTFHGFPAMRMPSSKTGPVTTEYLRFQARSIVVFVSTSYEFTYGPFVNDAAERLYVAAQEFGLLDFRSNSTPTP